MLRKQSFLQDGFSLIELLVALVISVITLQIFYTVSSRVLTDRYNAIQATADFELAQAAFDRFVSFYHYSAVNTLLAEQLGSGTNVTAAKITLTFDNSLSAASGSTAGGNRLIINATLNTDNNSNDADLVFSYYVAPETSGCSLVTAGSDYTISCTGGGDALNTWAAMVVTGDDFDHFFITVGSSGMMCRVTEIDANNWTVEATDDCRDLNGVSFLPPRVLFIAENARRPYNQTIIDSLADPQ